MVKKTDPGGALLAGAAFSITPANSATPPVSLLTEVTTGVFCIDFLLIGGSYTIKETVAPPGYDPAADQVFVPSTVGNCANVDGSTTADLTFINIAQTGAIRVTKTRKQAGSGEIPHEGVDFVVNGVTKATDANGVACFDGLAFGSYAVHEVVPANYQGEDDKLVTVDHKASCADAVYVGESVAFVNTPLSTIGVYFISDVPGATTATIQCTGDASQSPLLDGVPRELTSLAPGSYSCTVVIDP